MRSTVLARPAANVTASMLKISGLRMMLPQKEIRALEAADDIVRLDAEPPSVGWLHYAQQRWPVYCLSPELALLADIPATRRACVLLSAGDGYVGLLCDDVSISHQQSQQHELPPAMCLPNTPLLALAAMDDGSVVSVVSAKRLVAHVARLAGL